VTLIIHVIRTNKTPFLESDASWPSIFSSGLIVLSAMLAGYVVVTQAVKTWFYRRFPE
jgi:P-type Mg2+ transporter